MKDQNNRVGVWISVLYRCRKSFIAKKLEGLGSLSNLFMIVLAVNNHPGSSQEQIAGVLKLDKACIARSVQKLEADNYVRRDPDEQDKRANKLYLTAKAQALLPRIHEAIDEWERLVAGDVTGDDYALILNHLERMADRAYRIASGEGVCSLDHDPKMGEVPECER